MDYALAGRPLPPWLSTVGGYLPGAGTPQGIIIWSVIAAVLIVAVGAILSLLALYVSVRVSQRMVFDLALDVFEKLQRLSLTYHHRHRLGDLLQRVSQDVFVVFHAVSQVPSPQRFHCSTWLRDVHHPGESGSHARPGLPRRGTPLGSVDSLLRQTDGRHHHPHVRLPRSFTALAEQSLSAIKAVQGFARETYLRRKAEERARDLSDAYESNIRASGRYKEATNFITGTGAALLLGLGGVRVLAGRISLGDLLVFLGYSDSPLRARERALAVRGLRRGGDGPRKTRLRDHRCRRGGQRTFRRGGLAGSGRPRGEVIFEGVTFGYHEADSEAPLRPVLRDVSFRAWPGQTTAIVGATGAGKSSLVSLLSRFYDPWEGRILVDGHDVCDLSLHSLRESISLVLQEPFLFPMSIADNIGFGRPRPHALRSSLRPRPHAPTTSSSGCLKATTP